MFNDLSRTNILAENQMDMAVKEYLIKERVLECMRASRKDSSPNLLPSETLDVTCKSLMEHLQHMIDRYPR
jgi:hypothetical protein